MRRIRFLSVVLLPVFICLCLCTSALAQNHVLDTTEKSSTASLVSEQPGAIVRGTPTPSPVLQPTATPLPTPHILPPLDMASGIKLQWGELPGAQAYCIYRAETSEGPYALINTTEHYSRSYTDAQIAVNTQYWYYITCVINGEESLPSEKVHMSWTQRSNISNLRITLDGTNIRRFTIAWDDVTDSEYQVSVYLLDTKKDESWYWSGMTVTDHAMDYEYALPNTSYQIIVREVVTEQELTETIKIPKAPSYKDYGCKSKGASLKLINRYDLNNHVEPWDADGRKIGSIKRSTLADTFGGNDLYYVSAFTYTKASESHSVSELFVVRTPSGKVYYQDNSGHYNDFDGEEKNWTWTWYSPIDSVLYDLGGSYDDWEKGKYTIEQYFNGCLVNATTLTIQ